MWVLDVVAGDDSDSNTTFYLVAGEWIVGRKRCHFNFHTDSSISRTHALIRVGALTSEQLTDTSTRPTLELVDKHSRFGSFVNQEQCFGTRQLHHGDLITFGAKKTVLRVRYQVFVLVASRIQRANRAQVNDTCQRIGMHLVAAETKDATHCIMDPGRIVATVKVLWALVFNQPVVCTPWIYAILNRSSLSEPLPRCEEFLPSDPDLPSAEVNYLPNPLRKTLLQGHAVVFLTPHAMQDLVPAMGGIAITAYKDFREDDELLHELSCLASSKRLLLVEPSQSTGFSSTAGQSEQRASAADSPLCSVEIVERRAELLKSMGAVFTSVQEIAASVIFVKAPTAPNDSAFSSSLASHAGSSIQTMSFPEHLSLRFTPTVEHEEEEIKSKQKELSEDCKDCDVADVMIKEDMEQPIDCHYESAEVRDDDTFEDPSINIVHVPVVEQDKVSSSRQIERDITPRKSKNANRSVWKSSRVLRPHDVKLEQVEDDAGKPVVVSCELVVNKRAPLRQCKNGQVNYKRFKKGNGYGSRSSTASLYPQQTVVSVVDNADRVALQENLETMEEQERIAEELFAMGEGRTKTKLF